MHSFIANGLFIACARPRIDRWPAVIAYPVAGGEMAEARVHFDLRYLSVTDLRSLQAEAGAMERDLTAARARRRMAEAGLSADALPPPDGRAFPAEAFSDPLWPLGTPADPFWDQLLGWHGIGREDGEPLPIDAAGKSAILRDPLLRQGVIDALVSLAQGAPLKNSDPSPAAGRQAAAGDGQNRPPGRAKGRR